MRANVLLPKHFSLASFFIFPRVDYAETFVCFYLCTAKHGNLSLFLLSYLGENITTTRRNTKFIVESIKTKCAAILMQKLIKKKKKLFIVSSYKWQQLWSELPHALGNLSRTCIKCKLNHNQQPGHFRTRVCALINLMHRRQKFQKIIYRYQDGFTENKSSIKCYTTLHSQLNVICLNAKSGHQNHCGTWSFLSWSRAY